MIKKDYVLLIEYGDYALIDMGHQYVVAWCLNKKDMTWAHGKYFEHWNVSTEERWEMLLNAMDYMYERTRKGNKPSILRMQEIAEKCVSYLHDIKEDEFLEDELELDESEREYFGLLEESEDFDVLEEGDLDDDYKEI